MIKNKKDWLKLKPNVHFSSKLVKSDIKFIREYVEKSKNVSTHKFYPLIHYTKQTRHYKRKFNNKLNRKTKNRFSKNKNREIFFANHLDAQVYAYYARKLQDNLELIYKNNPVLYESVIGYRSIPLNNNFSRSKSNIDFANDSFKYIDEQIKKVGHILAICLDISDFFPSFNHRLLKKNWSSVIGFKKGSLPDDHYNIYKSVTNYSYVEISDILNEFKEFNVSNFSKLKLKKIDQYCKNPNEFRERIIKKGYVKKNDGIGIAQGTPISAVLSNVYMLDFDEKISEYIKNLDGKYWRYSDDILIVCKPKYKKQVVKFCIEFIQNNLQLVIKEEKTQYVSFKKEKEKGITTILTDNNTTSYNRPLKYLGFSYNGEYIYIRNKSISSYYRKLKRQIRRGAYFAFLAKKREENANFGKQVDPWIYRSKIYRTKSHLGSKTKKLNGKVYWGNFISYSNNASSVMSSPKIKRQLRNHWKIIHKEISYWENKYQLPKTPSKRNKDKSG